MDATILDNHDLDGDLGMSCGSAGGGGGGGSARWNPTKEQINMLESLYSQGIRTPSAEQIQQITSRLRTFGHIEGKNVFYWFQNHKARQRQKQKQESTMAFINHRYLHSPAPTVYPPPCPNVVCGSYYMPQSDLGLYPQYPKVLLSPSTGFRRKSISSPSYGCDVMMYPATFQSSNISSHDHDDEAFTRNCNNQETLPLFPLHPTGNLSSSFASSSDNNIAANYSSSSQSYEQRVSFDDQPFFDFFSGRSSG